MRYLILSDIHANFEALTAVLHHARRKRYSKILFLGDAVGYGASPNQVMEWLASLGSQVVIVRGNHDRVCAGLDSAEYFNRYARQAADWTHDHLESRHLERLRSLPTGPTRIEPGLLICHGSPVDEDAYVFSAHDALAAFQLVEEKVILFGHTHVPSAFIASEGDGRHMVQVRLLSGKRTVLDLNGANRYLINPGSVGQPRDRDPRAAYAIYDHEIRRLYQYRVPYRIDLARRKIRQAGLPPVLGDRLLYGA
ncbi:MAG: metallophosphatase family protein [Acidobacteria bacterium]|jgi:predicted phosphodiesterase|nr:metallophosphatase family protein [Acidobacteriota bacterium]